MGRKKKKKDKENKNCLSQPFKPKEISGKILFISKTSSAAYISKKTEEIERYGCGVVEILSLPGNNLSKIHQATCNRKFDHIVFDNEEGELRVVIDREGFSDFIKNKLGK